MLQCHHAPPGPLETQETPKQLANFVAKDGADSDSDPDVPGESVPIQQALRPIPIQRYISGNSGEITPSL